MSAMDSVLKRMGFVRLRDFGLVLTPDGRILSIRPAVLDDGSGGRIVGWKDDDLVSMELAMWAGLGRKPAAQPAVAPGVAVQTRVPGVVAPLTVAADSVVEEDDWEWTIAIARARAAADETEQVLVAATSMPRRTRADTVPPPAKIMVRTKPMISKPAVAPPTLPNIPRLRTIAQPNIPHLRTLPRQTVIPIPTLPTSPTAKFAPVVRPAGAPPVVRHMPTPLPPHPPRRFAKGTMPITPTSTVIKRPDDTATSLTIAAGDTMLPNMLMPAVARAATLPRVVARKA